MERNHVLKVYKFCCKDCKQREACKGMCKILLHW